MDEFILRDILGKTSFAHLAAYEEEWIDASGNTKFFDEMEKLAPEQNSDANFFPVCNYSTYAYSSS